MSMTDPFGFDAPAWGSTDTPTPETATTPAAPATTPAAPAPEPTPAPVVEVAPVQAPEMSGGDITLAIQIPNCTYFHADVRFSLNDIDKIPAWVETTGADLARNLETALTNAGLVKPRQAAAVAAPVLPVAGATGQVQIPAAPQGGASFGGFTGQQVAAPVAVGTGAAAIGALATGMAAPVDDGFARVANNYGKTVTFPSVHAYSEEKLRTDALGYLQAQYGLNPAVFHVYDNRRSAESGQPLRGTSVARIVLNKDYAPHFPTIKAAAWVAWKDGWKVDLTDEVKDVLLNNPQAAAALKVGA